MEHIRIRGRRVSLEPASPLKHLDVLLGWRNSNDWMEYCTYKKYEVSREEYLAEMSRAFCTDRQLQYVIEARGEPVGTTFVYGLNTTAKHAWFTLFLDKKYRRAGLGIDAGVLLCDHLYNNYDLHKIYTDVYGHNKEALKLHHKIGFECEGVRRQHRVSNGIWRDLYLFALFRARAMELINTKFSRVF